ncbi:DUF6261 family protein [Chryseobacterium sp. Leaf394]|uniref:DUF6261 family protein n=1 Tax=Chryseobacterium sp. Leaf394 TaxID=1736361 RepID=UPI0006F7048B|nr:DUF6261 family protein [Chryseobacterium sp. Leaf394]KQS92492.1 hypothetical protein ASG21_08640 [Chryseobacterium sp. Leaf394]
MSKIKLKSLYAKALHHSEFGQLIVRLFEDLGSSSLNPDDDPNAKKLFTVLQNQLPAYNAGLNQVRASEESEAIARLDKERDSDIQALRDSLKPYRNAKNTEEADAYKKIQLLLSEYKNVDNDSYEAETNQITQLISRLESSDFSNAVAQLAIGKFVNHLSVSNAAFNNLFAERSFKTSQKNVSDMKSLRKTLAEDYKKLTTYILAMASVEENVESYYKDLLAIINNGRGYFSDVVVSRRLGK